MTAHPKNEILQDPEKVKLLTGLLLAKAQSARRNVPTFFEFVMLEETTRRPIRVQPHQRVVLDFIMAHDQCVLMLPVGTSKTYMMGGLSCYFLGQDPTTRGAIISATQGQAAKPLSMVKDYIETSPHLRLVFPALKPATRGAWTTTQFTVERPPGIRDPSMVAIGLEGAIPGARLNWIIIDDILTHENTLTHEQRSKTFEWVDSSVLSRVDPNAKAKVVVCNTAWHPDDVPHRLKGLGWPTLRMDIEGGIEISGTDWDSNHIRPASPNPLDPLCRLSAHDATSWEDHKQGGICPLWPGRYSWDFINNILRKRHLPYRFNQLFMNLCRDDDTSKCKQEWIDRCKLLGQGLRMVSQYRGPNLTFTGVDLAISEGEEHDDTVFFTFEVLPNGRRRILDIDIGQFDGPTIVRKIGEKGRAYQSVIKVENNAAQDYIRQFVLDKDASIPIKPYTTGRVKAHPEHGIMGLFIELHNDAWEIPCDSNGFCHPNIQRWIDACLYYVPAKHTDDTLMACFFAREQAKEFGVLSGSGVVIDPGAGLSSLFVR